MPLTNSNWKLQSNWGKACTLYPLLLLARSIIFAISLGIGTILTNYSPSNLRIVYASRYLDILVLVVVSPLFITRTTRHSSLLQLSGFAQTPLMPFISSLWSGVVDVGHLAQKGRLLFDIAASYSATVFFSSYPLLLCPRVVRTGGQGVMAN